MTASAGRELTPLRWWHLPQAMALEHELFGSDQWSEETFWSELALCAPTLERRVTRCYLAIVEAGVLAAYGGTAFGAGEAYVQTVGVGLPWQGRGLGRQLTAGLLDEARAHGASTCWLEVRTDNEAAQALYRGLGFSPRGVRRGYYQPSGADALVMEARL